MDDNAIQAIARLGFADLLRRVEHPDFDRAVLKFISQAGMIRNFGAYFWTSVRRKEMVMSIAGGEIGAYWFHRDARDFISNVEVFTDLHSLVASRAGPDSDLLRFVPSPSDPRYANYRRAGIAERLAVATRVGDNAVLSFFLRSGSDGPIDAAELRRFEIILPIVHEIITIRHRIVGSEAFQFKPGLSTSSLKERGVPIFSALSGRETQVCDSILAGYTVEGTALELGVSLNTVRTLRSRAYRKLRVSSAQQMMSLILFEMQLIMSRQDRAGAP
nr:helix-turn-helix transcriptional regulator [Aquicoccus sp. G2-2]MEA1112229.1 helix-turn-helix transcriptional regulator [Aquicoccus sp. G2-2]